MIDRAHFNLDDSVYIVSVQEYLSCLKEVAINSAIVEKSDFRMQRAREAYIAAVSQSDLRFVFPIASKAENADTDATLQLNGHNKIPFLIFWRQLLSSVDPTSHFNSNISSISLTKTKR